MNTSKRELRRTYRQRRSQALSNHHNLQTVIAQQVLDEIRERHAQSPFQGHLGRYWPLPGAVNLAGLRPRLAAPVPEYGADPRTLLRFRNLTA